MHLTPSEQHAMQRCQRIDPQRLHAAQNISPYNRDDAEYILAHPREFDADTRAIALRTKQRHAV